MDSKVSEHWPARSDPGTVPRWPSQWRWCTSVPALRRTASQRSPAGSVFVMEGAAVCTNLTEHFWSLTCLQLCSVTTLQTSSVIKKISFVWWISKCRPVTVSHFLSICVWHCCSLMVSVTVSHFCSCPPEHCFSNLTEHFLISNIGFQTQKGCRAMQVFLKLTHLSTIKVVCLRSHINIIDNCCAHLSVTVLHCWSFSVVQTLSCTVEHFSSDEPEQSCSCTVSVTEIKQGEVSVLVKWGDPRNLTGGALLFWDLLTVGCVGDAALGVWHCLTLLPAAHGTDVVVDSLALLLVDGGALLLIHCLTGRSCLAGSSIARLCWSRSSLTRSSVARRGSRGGSVGGMVTTSETSETNPIRTSLGSVLDRAPPTLLSQAESQYGGAQ